MRVDTAPEPGATRHSGDPELTDEELCRLIREGAAWPLETLWQRHSAIARSWAAKKDPGAAEDIVAEGFTSVFQALVGGGGPTESFRAYLYKTMESSLIKHWAAQRRTSRLDDLDTLVLEDEGVSPDALSGLQEQRAAAEALVELPERWREVIVAVDVERRSVQEVAASLGLSPNSTSVLLKRAREGLRKAWVQRLHRPTPALPDDCASAVTHFGILRWGRQGTRRRTATERHLAACSSCSARYAQFLEQATAVGLGLAGLLTLTRDWRDKLIPTLATSATVVASFSITVSVEPIVLDPPWHTAPLPADEAPAMSDTGTSEPAYEGGTVRDPRPGAGGDEGAPEPAGPEAVEAPAAGDGEADPGGGADSDGGAEGTVDRLYFGDWTGWNEEEQRFIGTP